jgi:hypothetical protein
MTTSSSMGRSPPRRPIPKNRRTAEQSWTRKGCVNSSVQRNGQPASCQTADAAQDIVAGGISVDPGGLSPEGGLVAIWCTLSLRSPTRQLTLSRTGGYQGFELGLSADSMVEAKEMEPPIWI